MSFLLQVQKFSLRFSKLLIPKFVKEWHYLKVGLTPTGAINFGIIKSKSEILPFVKCFRVFYLKCCAIHKNNDCIFIWANKVIIFKQMSF